MAQPAEWSIVFYTREDGRSDVAEFLDQLDQKTHARFIWSIEQLRVRNVQARPPLVGHIGGKLWELREESSTNIFHILYVFLTGRRILLLHGFPKKSQKTPPREIATAEARLPDFLRREGGEHR